MPVLPLSMVPSGAAKFRGGPLRPLAFLRAPILHPTANTRRFEITETLGIREGGGKRRTRGAKVQKTREKGGFEGIIPTFWCPAGSLQVPWGSFRFRGVPPGSAVAHFACLPIVHGSVGRRLVPRWPIAPDGFFRAPIPRPPTDTRRFETAETLGFGYGRNGKTRGSQAQKPRQIGGCGFVGNNALLLVFRQGPWGPARLRGVPQWPIVPAGVSPHSCIPPTNLYQAFRNRRNSGYRGMGEGENERAKLKKRNKRWIRWGNYLLLAFRGTPAGSAGIRSGPLCPLAFPRAPIFRPPTNTRRFETAETLGIGEGGRGKREGRKRKKHEKKKVDLRG